MKYLIFAAILILTLIYYMLEVSFRSFSKVSLTGFLDDMENKRIKKFDFVKNYRMVLNSLRALSFSLQLILFMYSYFLLGSFLPNPYFRIILLIFMFLLLFNFFLYTLSSLNREKILKKLIFLYKLPWIFFFPANIVFSFLHKKKPEEKEDEQDDLSEKELEVFIEEGAKEGVIEKEDKELIKSVLEFGDTRVKEIMTPWADIIYVDIDEKISKIVKTIKKNKKSRYPVISGRIDNIEGMILSKDLFDYWQKKEFHIKRILRKPFIIPETMRILELLKEMQRSKQKFSIVVDEFGGIAGVVTMEDIIEEIVGEIHDEYDEDVEQIIKEKNYFIVKGDTDISELNEALKTKFEEKEDFQTIAGLISFKLGKIPGITDKITVEGYTLEVIEMEKNRIKKVKIYSEKN